jgi:putative membrane protein
MDDWGWGGWLMMTAGFVAFWGLVAWVVVLAIRGPRPSTPPAASPPDPDRILAARFAAGEIGEEEYRRRLDVLRGAGKAP